MTNIENMGQYGGTLLRIRYVNLNNEFVVIFYGAFSVASEAEKFALTISDYSGNTGQICAITGSMGNKLTH